MALIASRISETPYFEVCGDSAGYVDIRFLCDDIPYDIVFYILSTMGTPRFNPELRSMYAREIYAVLRDIIERGLLWLLRGRWVVQPNIWDELVVIQDKCEDFNFDE